MESNILPNEQYKAKLRQYYAAKAKEANGIPAVKPTPKKPTAPKFEPFDATPRPPFKPILLGKDLAITLLSKLTDSQLMFFKQIIRRLSTQSGLDSITSFQYAELKIRQIIKRKYNDLCVSNKYGNKILSISKRKPVNRIAIITNIQDAYIARNPFTSQLLDPIGTPPDMGSMD